jgi:hypothetical protein
MVGSVVVPDGGGEGEDALQDPDGYSADGVTAVLFQVELAFEGVVDRLDDLAEGLEVPGACPLRLALAGGPQEPDPRVGDGGLKAGTEVVLVPGSGSGRVGWRAGRARW